jgi:sulfur-oxidizing protein SoxB
LIKQHSNDQENTMHTIKLVAGICLGAALLATAGCKSGQTPASENPPGSAVTITFIHMNDLHAHLLPHADVVPDAPTGTTASSTRIVTRGGLARSATLIQEIRAANPNSVLMNIGDTYHGGVEALYTNGNAIVDPVNALGIDVGVPGNWDYAYGPLVTRERYATLSSQESLMLSQLMGSTGDRGEVKRPSFPNLAANVSYSLPPAKAGQPFLPPTLLKTIGGVKVGFIGITSDIVAQMSEMLAIGLTFVQGEDNYRQLLNQHASDLRAQGAVVVVVMSELGIHKDKRLAQIIQPGSVDVFFSAHTHEAVFTPLTSNSGALVVEAGNDGYLGRMDVTVAQGKATGFVWKLLPVDSSIVADPAVQALVDSARAPFLVAQPNLTVPMPYTSQALLQPINTVVGHTDGPLDRRHALENTFNDVYTDALRRTTGTDLVLTPGFRFDSVIPQTGTTFEDNTVANGDITLEDVYRFFPVSYTLSTAQVSGLRLKQIVEQNLSAVYSQDAFRQGGGWFDGYSGLGLQLNLANPDGARVISAWLLNSGNSVNDGDLYSITGCTRPLDAADTLCSYSGLVNVQPLINAKTAAAWTVADMFVELLSKGSLPTHGQKRFTDLSNTPVWPEAPFVQPVTP